jgi:HAE1 family hydrophobic/amphiphilic exporter-1
MVTRTMDGLSLPTGYRWGFAGQASDQRDSFTQLGLGLGASVLLMYMVLSILYENWLQPALILSALPLATVGAFLGLFAFHQNLGISAFIGIIALFGMVGKNSILLVDRANDLRGEGLDRTTALEQAGDSRLRPILMTSMVLILSMLPVALKLGEGGEQRAPIGAILVGGMVTSTLLSLLYVPVAYTYFDSLGTFISRLVSWRPRLPRLRRASQTEATARPSRSLRPHPLPPIAGGADPEPASERPGSWPTSAGPTGTWRPRSRRSQRSVAHHERLLRRPGFERG